MNPHLLRSFNSSIVPVALLRRAVLQLGIPDGGSAYSLSLRFWGTVAEAIFKTYGSVCQANPNGDLCPDGLFDNEGNRRGRFSSIYGVGEPYPSAPNSLLLPTSFDSTHRNTTVVIDDQSHVITEDQLIAAAVEKLHIEIGGASNCETCNAADLQVHRANARTIARQNGLLAILT